MELHDAVKKAGSKRAAARELGIPESTLRYRLDRERQDAMRSFVLPANIKFPVDPARPRHFIVTGAQDKTTIHSDFWNNLLAYQKFLGNCELLVGGFTYSKKLFTENDPTVRNDDVWFDERVEPYILHEKVALGDKLVFCAEMNTLPTAVQPLSGLETYTGAKWGIFPHTKVQLRSVATGKNELSKQILTSGAVTLPNYIRKKAGVKAQFHHVIGAVVVTVAPDGAFWCRHIQADDEMDGTFCDLDRMVKGGRVTEGHRVEAMTYGDIHREKLDPVVALTTWGFDIETNMVILGFPSLDQKLKPKVRFFHDLADFTSRNHHNIKDHDFRFDKYFNGPDNVESDMQLSATFIKAIEDPDIEDVVVQSNHDNALLTWMKTAEAKHDPENYEFWLKCELKYCGALRQGKKINIFHETMLDLGMPERTVFVGEDDSYRIFDIECAMHGHLGANGARGSVNAFTKMGAKSNTGHSHSPNITDGSYVGGVSGLMDMGYNKGLSSWAQAHIITYKTGKRAIVTMMNGRWFG